MISSFPPLGSNSLERKEENPHYQRLNITLNMSITWQVRPADQAGYLTLRPASSLGWKERHCPPTNFTCFDKVHAHRAHDNLAGYLGTLNTQDMYGMHEGGNPNVYQTHQAHANRARHERHTRGTPKQLRSSNKPSCKHNGQHTLSQNTDTLSVMMHDMSAYRVPSRRPTAWQKKERKTPTMLEHHLQRVMDVAGMWTRGLFSISPVASLGSDYQACTGTLLLRKKTEVHQS